jgi:hypothetical protein
VVRRYCLEYVAFSEKSLSMTTDASGSEVTY